MSLSASALVTWTRPSMLAMYGGDLPTAVGQSAEEMIPRDLDRRRFYRLAPPLLRVVRKRRQQFSFWSAGVCGSTTRSALYAVKPWASCDPLRAPP